MFKSELELFKFFNPTMSFTNGDIARIPIIEMQSSLIDSLVQQKFLSPNKTGTLTKPAGISQRTSSSNFQREIQLHHYIISQVKTKIYPWSLGMTSILTS